MADNKLEQMLEKLVNNDRAGADELFHEFVIEKSRGIYEKMLENDLEDLEVDEAKDEEVDEASKDEEETNEATDEEVDEASDDEETNEATDEEVDEASKDEEVDEASDEDVEEATDEKTDENFGEITPEADPMGGDPADDMMGDIEADADGEGDMGGDDEEEIEDRVVDLEDALDDLKAEFEKMMAGDKGDDEGDEDAADMDMDDEGDEDKEEAIEVPSELSVEDEAMPFESKAKTAGEQMREYVEKVAEPKGEDNKAKSPVASKNDMGGTASNIAAGGEGSTSGSAMSSKEENAGNVNVPGGKASKSMSNAKGHGAEKKGAGETGANTKSTIGS